MAGTTEDGQPINTQADAAALQKLSRIVAGNDNLVTQPGLTLALFQGNATTEQASAINAFLGGLQTEQAVRTAAAAGTKIQLSSDEKSSLSAMGIDYSHVEFTQQDAVSSLKSEMAAKGMQPVLDASGNVQTNAAGDVLAKPIEQPKKHKSGNGWFDSVGSFFHHATHNDVTNLIGSGSIDGNSAQGPNAGLQAVGGAIGKVNEGYQWLSTNLSQMYKFNQNPGQEINAEDQDKILAARLGYDPSSFFSMQAFKAKGYAHGDTTAAQAHWDDQNPNGLFGWNGTQAVTEAEVFAADPAKYRRNIENDQSLTPEQLQQKLEAINSKQFQDLVLRVNGDKSDIGTDVARGIGVDPVKHPTAFAYTAAGANLVAAFATDPLAFTLKARTAAKVASTTVNLSDANSIERVLRPVGGSSTMAQSNVIAHVKDMVSSANELRAAAEAGDTVKAAKIAARVNASNPFAPLLPDFIGEDQILGKLTDSTEALNLSKGELPFITGRGEAIDTFDKAVDYLASGTALLRLQRGLSGAESSVMPGALSSWGYSKIKGSLASWSAGRSAAKSEAAAEKFVSSAKADPGKLESALKDGYIKPVDLTRVLPTDTDAIDLLSGKVLASERSVAASQELADRWAREAAHTGDAETRQVADAAQAKLATDQAQLASARRALQSAKMAPLPDDVEITDAGRGLLRGNQLRYGLTAEPTTKLGKGLAIYTLGTVQRAKLALSRFTNWLPRDTQIDLTSAASADTIRKIARTYLTSGDANMLATRWINGNAETRKTIVQGLREQLIHASGMSRTKAGQDLIAKWRAGDEQYATFGREFVDSNGRNAAQWPGQVQTKFALPNFGEVHKAAAKIGLYEGTIGRALTSDAMDKLLTQWKLGALATPVTAVRANIESWLNSYAEGMFAQGVKAKALLRETDQLNGLDISRSRGVDKILSLAPLQGAGRVYRHLVLKAMPGDIARAIAEMPDDLLHAYIHDQAAYHYAMSVDPAGVNEATQIARNGFHAVKASYDSKEGFEAGIKTRKGYELTDEVDGVAGANLYAHNLAMRINKAPEVARAVLDRLEGLTREGSLVDTRGGGVFFHGARGPVGDLSRGYYNNANIYGGADTLYTTDAADVARSYGRKSASAKVYRVSETKPVKFFDMEQSQSVASLKKIFGTSGNGSFSEFVNGAIEDAAARKGGHLNLREAMDAIRNESRAEGYSRDEVQEVFDNASYNLQQRGYGGMRHVGGLQTGTRAHEVRIYLNPSEQLSLTEHEPAREQIQLGADHVVQALESGQAKRLMDQSLFGKVFIRPDGTQAKAVTEADVELGKQQWADQITGDLKQLLTGRNGKLQGDLVAKIRDTGKAPDADWILDNMKGMNRPSSMLKPVFDAVPANPGLKGFLEAIQQAEGKGYQWMVERLIQRHTTTPLFAAAYGKSRVGLESLKQSLIDGGLSEEAAEHATANVAAEQAWSRISKMVDDPRLKSQMDVAGRSFFAFSRATTMMLRRWGGTFWRNPAQARRFQLAGEAAVHSGLVYKDQNGDWTFHFPASGVAQEVLFHAMSHIPGLEGLAQFPVSDFSGRVTSIIPGSSNPFQYNTTPMVSIAGRQIASLFPDHRELFDEIDAKLNGSQGQGQGIVATLEPNLIKKLNDPRADDRNSVTTSAMVGALYNLYASGQVPKDGASPSELEDFMGRLRTQTKSVLYARALLGMISPASINTPEGPQGKADFAWATTGAQGLRDEYKAILNDVHGDLGRANVIWTALHPDLTVYEQSGSQSLTKGADMPYTQAAYQWMAKNSDFIQKYKDVSAFFIPQPSGNQPFSMQAYRAQIEEGLRQKKTPEEFLTGVRVAGAASIYYAVEAQYQADLAAAKAQGNTALAAQHRADWAAWSKQFKAQHPSFAAKTEASTANIVQTYQQLADLKSMVQNNDVPDGQRDAVAGMLKAYDGYKKFVDSVPGSTNQAIADRAGALSTLQTYLAAVVKARPGLTDLYNAVFRPLVGYHLDSISAGG